jgi:hypothetical protein
MVHVSNEGFEPEAQSDRTDASKDELQQLKQELDQGSVRTTLRTTADGRNPGCSGK